MSVTLKYGSTSMDFSELGVRGFTRPDDMRYICQNKVLADGSIYQRLYAHKRGITVDLGVILDATQSNFLAEFIKSATKTLTYLGIEVSVNLENAGDFANEWIDGCEIARYYVLKLEEALPSVTIPIEFGTRVIETDPAGNPITDPAGNYQYVWIR